MSTYTIMHLIFCVSDLCRNQLLFTARLGGNLLSLKTQCNFGVVDSLLSVVDTTFLSIYCE